MTNFYLFCVTKRDEALEKTIESEKDQISTYLLAPFSVFGNKSGS